MFYKIKILFFYIMYDFFILLYMNACYNSLIYVYIWNLNSILLFNL